MAAMSRRPSLPPMPDLSHLTAEERQIIESVLVRQRHHEVVAQRTVRSSVVPTPPKHDLSRFTAEERRIIESVLFKKHEDEVKAQEILRREVVPQPPPKPELGHLTAEERQIIESVLLRQREEEEKEQEILRSASAILCASDTLDSAVSVHSVCQCIVIPCFRSRISVI